MGDLAWFIIIGLIALGGVIFYLVQDAKESPALAGMHEPVEALNLTYGDAVTAAAPAGSGWRVLGWLLAIGGAVALAVSLLLNTSLPTYSAAIVGLPSEVVNLDLLFRKGIAIACSLTAIGIGLLCLATGAIIQAIHSRPV